MLPVITGYVAGYAVSPGHEIYPVFMIAVQSVLCDLAGSQRTHDKPVKVVVAEGIVNYFLAAGGIEFQSTIGIIVRSVAADNAVARRPYLHPTAGGCVIVGSVIDNGAAGYGISIYSLYVAV